MGSYKLAIFLTSYFQLHTSYIIIIPMKKNVVQVLIILILLVLGAIFYFIQNSKSQLPTGKSPDTDVFPIQIQQEQTAPQEQQTAPIIPETTSTES